MKQLMFFMPESKIYVKILFISCFPSFYYEENGCHISSFLRTLGGFSIYEKDFDIWASDVYLFTVYQ